MTRQAYSSFRPNLEALEDRRVMNASGFVADTQLTAYLRRPYANYPYQEVYVDGSIYDDHVTVLEFASGASGYVKLKLEQKIGTTLLSSKTVVVSAPNLQVSGWEINVELREGNDQLLNDTYARMHAHGGSGNDILIGGFNYDFIEGGSGLNNIMGRDGNDALYGGDDADAITGGAGNDVVRGYGGNDYLAGDVGFSPYVVGNDVIEGGNGNDTLVGGPGYDQMRGDQGNDTMWGGQDGDWMWGGADNDILYGEAGSDRLYGEGGMDRLYGGTDDDFLDGGYGDPSGTADFLEGGQGRDTFVRHKRVFWFDDRDIFNDYRSSAGDRVQNVWHA